MTDSCVALAHIELPPFALRALRTLEGAGFECWCAGPCVRAMLLGGSPCQFDIIAHATKEEVEQALRATGLIAHDETPQDDTPVMSYCKHAAGSSPTYTVQAPVCKADPCSGKRVAPELEQLFETTAMAEDDITVRVLSAHDTHTLAPDTMAQPNEPTSFVEKSLACYGFTTEALAFHPDRGLLDCWDGCCDLRQGVIRVIEDAYERLLGYPLHILHACTLCSELGFSFDPRTFQAMNACKMRLVGSPPRLIAEELERMLLGEHVHDALMTCIDVIGAVLPEVAACKGFDQHTPYHIYDVLEHTAWVVQLVPPDPLLRWSALFHDIGKPGAFFLDGNRGHFYGHPRLSDLLTQGIVDRLELPPAFAERMRVLVLLHDKTIPATRDDVLATLAQMNGDTGLFRDLCKLKYADAKSHSDLGAPRVKLAIDLERALDELLAEQPC